ncbi:MAG: hypothetical protein WKF30_01740 [Pyrinomonadaceae bacterium]
MKVAIFCFWLAGTLMVAATHQHAQQRKSSRRQRTQRVVPTPHKQAQHTDSQTQLVYPNGLTLNQAGDLYISDIGTHRILKLDRRHQVTVIAGTGEAGFSGDQGPAVKAQLFAPHDLALDAEGHVLIADTYNHRVRRIDSQGVITTVAGNGQAKYAGDNGSALAASLNLPQSIALDRDGNMLIADTYNYAVRRVDRQGTMTTFAGSVPGFAGDGGLANKAQLSLPMAIAVAPDNSVYISDAGNSRVRRVGADGKIQTLIGHGAGEGVYGAGFTGDGGPAEKAKIYSATDLEFDAAGDLYISDSGNNRIRVVRAVIQPLSVRVNRAGGDAGQALAAELNTPQKIAVDRDGQIFIADRANHRVRKVDKRV